MNKTAYGIISVLVIIIAVLLSKPVYTAFIKGEVNIREDDQELFAGNFIYKTNLLLLLKTGKQEEAMKVLKDSLESELKTISEFKESNFKTVALYNAGLVNEKCEKEIFDDNDLKEQIELHQYLNLLWCG